MPEDESSESDGEEETGQAESDESEPDEPPIELPPRHLFVPVDALARAYPEEQGYRFDFDRRLGRLEVSRTAERALEVEVDRVHDLGATTLVVTFSGRPRYRVDRYSAGLRLRLLSGVMEPRPRQRLNDPLVRWLEVRERSIDIGLAPRAEASEPYLLGRPPRVQLVLDVTRDRLGRTPSALVRREEEASDLRIVIDPGHGGSDTGLSSAAGETEKDVVLEMARELRSHLEATVGARVVLTRTDDSEVALENRTAAANQRLADLFLSLHASSTSGSFEGSGFQTYILDPPPARFESEEGAESEVELQEEAEQDDLVPEEFEDDGFDHLGAESGDEEEIRVVVPMLQPWERVHDSQLGRSGLLARLIQSHVSDALGLPNRQVARAPLRVLTGAGMPAVLIEVGSLASGEDEASLLDESYRRQVIEAIGRAIRLYQGVTVDASEAAATGARIVTRVCSCLMPGVVVALLAGCGGSDPNGDGDGEAELVAAGEAFLATLCFPGVGGVLRCDERPIRAEDSSEETAASIVRALITGPAASDSETEAEPPEMSGELFPALPGGVRLPGPGTVRRSGLCRSDDRPSRFFG